MPCHAARARELIRKDRAVRRFDRGLFYIRLLDRQSGETDAVVVGIDPGSKKEAFTVKSEHHTYLNIQTDAVTWVKDRVETRREMRRTRRSRKTPYRKCRRNRRKGESHIPPSTRARWNWKLRICNWLSRYYPISLFAVEDVQAKTRQGQRRWNVNFSPVEIGKTWFYDELSKVAPVELIKGYETYEARNWLGLKKSKNKLSDSFNAHCVDSWVIANKFSGGHTKPDNNYILYMIPYRFLRRQLHKLQPTKGGVRQREGGTVSLGFKRGSWVKHTKYGLSYIGGNLDSRVSLHSLKDGKRLCQNAKPTDCQLLTTSSWRTRKEEVRYARRQSS